MARRVYPVLHTQTRPVLGGRGTRTGSIFVGWRRRWRDKKPAASTLPRSLSLSIPRFFPSSSLPLLASQPPLFSLRAPLFLLPRRFCRAPFSSFSPLFLSLPPPHSLSLSPRGNRSVELALFPSFSHPAKLATILPCPAFLVSLSRPAVPTTAEAIEHTSDEDRTIPPSALDKDREKERGERRKP